MMDVNSAVVELISGQAAGGSGNLAHFSAGIGAGLAIIGAGLGIGKLAASGLEGIARQPSAVGDIRATLIIAAGLIEGATLFALVITILLALK